jgi:hypothetical protein
MSTGMEIARRWIEGHIPNFKITQGDYGIQANIKKHLARGNRDMESGVEDSRE